MSDTDRWEGDLTHARWCGCEQCEQVREMSAAIWSVVVALAVLLGLFVRAWMRG